MINVNIPQWMINVNISLNDYLNIPQLMINVNIPQWMINVNISLND
jgi:hypothetical protein